MKNVVWVHCGGCFVSRIPMSPEHFEEVKAGTRQRPFCSTSCKEAHDWTQNVIKQGRALNHPKDCPGNCFGEGTRDWSRWGGDFHLCPGTDLKKEIANTKPPTPIYLVPIKFVITDGSTVPLDEVKKEPTMDQRQEVPVPEPVVSKKWDLVTWTAVLAPFAILLGFALLIALAAAGSGR